MSQSQESGSGYKLPSATTMQDHLETLQQFRQALYSSFRYRRDSLLDLIDALSSNDRAQAPVELSLNPLFRRRYSALYRAISAAYLESEFPVCSLESDKQEQAILATIPLPSRQSYQVFGIDETPTERLYARCLADRQTVHRSTPVPGQLPISLGHNYSILAVMPEASPDEWPRWAVPCSVERVSTLSNAITVAQSQVAQLMRSPRVQLMPLKVLTVDSRYPTPAFLHPLNGYRDLVIVARLRGNRVVFQHPDSRQDKTRPRWYGERFCLQEEATWPAAQEEATVSLTDSQGRAIALQLRRWSNLLMRGTRLYPMHRFPFDLVQVQSLNDDQHPKGRPLWLLVWGQHRQQLPLVEVRQAYSQRFNLEHFLGFAKPHLLLSALQSCLTAHEINWVRLSCLAYVQLWLARDLVSILPLPWQRYLAQGRKRQATPRSVQRSFARLIQQMGSIAVSPKPRGILPGRARGTRLTPRAPCPQVKFHPSRKRCRCQNAQKTS
ncbi:MAG: transposase [Leptolyngbya sp. SIO1E4]|nr:transposase [Leptolyngbya sp. SIO1E4]